MASTSLINLCAFLLFFIITVFRFGDWLLWLTCMLDYVLGIHLTCWTNQINTLYKCLGLKSDFFFFFFSFIGIRPFFRTRKGLNQIFQRIINCNYYALLINYLLGYVVSRRIMYSVVFITSEYCLISLQKIIWPLGFSQTSSYIQQL